MKAFLQSNAGKGTAGVCLSCLILACPLVASWLVAGITLYFAVHHLRQAFRQLDVACEPAPPVIDLPSTALTVATRGESTPCDVNAVMAALAAQSAPPGG